MALLHRWPRLTEALMRTNTWPICGQRAWEESLQSDCLISWDSWKLPLTTPLTTGEAPSLLPADPFQSEPPYRQEKLLYN